ncbi:MAG: DUF2961 domain-containing protein [Chloroflexi bacterium]|nr:DUF2961 domain-containing protein [Chloroflexota bacterium]
MACSGGDYVFGLADLARLRDERPGRVSSWDRSGGNRDFVAVPAGARARLADLFGAGRVTHIWTTMHCDEPHFLRKVVLRMWWDGEPAPSVEVPIGDFFGIGHALTRSFWSLPLQMSPQDGRGFTCFFPMPFATAARIEVENQCETAPVNLYYYLDYVRVGRADPEDARFHAQWRRQNPCDGIDPAGLDNRIYQMAGKNLTGRGNYVILDATGRGHYVGCHLDIQNLRRSEEWDWPGEGDDMIWVDQDPERDWPPRLHGTGTEDYFGTAYCPTQEYSSPFHGVTLGGGRNWHDPVSFYRYHVLAPIRFERNIRVTVEHGHANRRSDDYSSTAYWYQVEPHVSFPPLLPVAERLPITPAGAIEYT